MALALGWLAIGGFGNAFVWRAARAALPVDGSSPIARFVEAASSPLFTVLALTYGATALIASIAIWRMRSWMVTAYAAWGAAVTITGVWMVIAIPSELLAGGTVAGIAFVAGLAGLLWVGYRYVQQIAPRPAEVVRVSKSA